MDFNEKKISLITDHLKEWQQIGGRLKLNVVQSGIEEKLEKMFGARGEFESAIQLTAQRMKADSEEFKSAIQLTAQRMKADSEEFKSAFQLVAQRLKADSEKMFDMGSVAEQIVQRMKADTEKMFSVGSEIRNRILEQIKPVFEAFNTSLNELPAQTRDALILLGEYGWYIDLFMPMPDIWEFERVLSEGNVKEAEDALAAHFESREKAIEKSIVERFPNRSHIIASAFNAHRRGEYDLSIPVMLSQTDGICKELINHDLFTKRGGKPDTAIYFNQIASNTFQAALLSPISVTLPINASMNERPEGFDELNRHMVLHGESTNYGTKTNSLKAISLINYIAHVLDAE